MAAQRAPGWEAFGAATDRVGNSAKQLAQALQASATVPDDLVTISAQLRQLEHQPTNLQLLEQVQQIRQDVLQSQQQMNARFTQMDDKFSTLHHNLAAQMDARFTQVDDKFAQMDDKFSTLHHNLVARMDEKFSQVDARFTQMDARFTQVDGKFAQMDDKFSALNLNMVARARNAQLDDKTRELTPIVNPITNAPIADFPQTSAALSSLAWARKRTLGIEMGLADPGANATPATRATFLETMRLNMGLKPSPA